MATKNSTNVKKTTSEKKVVKRQSTKKPDYDDLPNNLTKEQRAYYEMVRNTMLDSAYNNYEDLSKITLRQVMLGADTFINTHGDFHIDNLDQFKREMEALIKFIVILYAPNAYDGFFEEEILKPEIDKKANASKFGNVMKAFDYIGFIFVIGAVIICFAYGGGFGTIAGIYLIWRIISVIRSVCKNTDVAKNTSNLLNTVLKAKEIIRKGDDKDEILKALSLKDILSKK